MTTDYERYTAEADELEAEAEELKQRAYNLQNAADEVMLRSRKPGGGGVTEQDMRQARKDREVGHRMLARSYEMADVAYSVRQKGRMAR